MSVNGKPLIRTIFDLYCRYTCGNCSRQLLQNANECYCCSKLEGCVEALESDIVREDITELS